MTVADLVNALRKYNQDAIVCTYDKNCNLVEPEYLWETQVAGNQINRKTGLMDAVVLF